MRIDQQIKVLAGTLVTLGTVLAYTVDVRWFLLTLFVGLNLLQYGFTDWCLSEKLLRRLQPGKQ